MKLFGKLIILGKNVFIYICPYFLPDQAAGAHLASLMQNCANLGTGIIMSFVTGWELTLLILAFMPIVAVFATAQVKMFAGHAAEGKTELETSGKVDIFIPL